MQPTTFVFLAVLAALTAAQPGVLSSEWEMFKNKFEKVYESLEEENKRVSIFNENLQRIIEHNTLFEANLKSYQMAVNQFTDMLPHEIVGADLPDYEIDGATFYASEGKEIPKSVDWREKEGVVTSVKDQGLCGSCWAFSATGGIEGQTMLKLNKKVSLSEQQLVDCSTASFGCGGGYKVKAWTYVKKAGGIESEEDYPYKAKDGHCKFDSSKVAAKVTGFKRVMKNNETDLARAVAEEGPVSVSIYVMSSLFGYTKGIYADFDCPRDSHNHAVLVVGYGHDEATGYDFWIVKNSWGPKWGEKGYFRIVRNRGSLCAIALIAAFPTVV